MADILIRMEMPKNCMVCDFRNRGFDLNGDLFCNCRLTKENVPDYYNLRMENCPLHELPEHGRLIDADKLLHPDPSTESTPFAFTTCKIIEAPTVIPSNKEDD